MCALNSDDIAFCPEFFYNITHSLLKKVKWDFELTNPWMQLTFFRLRVKIRSSNAGFFTSIELHLARHSKCGLKMVQRVSVAENMEIESTQSIINKCDFYCRPNCQSAEIRTAGSWPSSKDMPFQKNVYLSLRIQRNFSIWFYTSRIDAHMLAINISETDYMCSIFFKPAIGARDKLRKLHLQINQIGHLIQISYIKLHTQQELRRLTGMKKCDFLRK